MINKFTYSLLLFFIAVLSCKANIVVTNGLTHIIAINGKSVYKGKISIQNTGNTSQNVKLYQKDYSYNAEGISSYLDFGENERSNLKWIKLSSDLVKVAAKSTVDVVYEIHTPEQELPGSNWSVILVEPVDEQLASNNKEGVQIKTIVRFAIQIITNNNLEANSQLTFTNVSLTKNADKNYLEVDIANTGELFHNVVNTLEVFDKNSGNKIAEFKSDTLSLLPNNSKRFKIEIASLPFGNYLASLYASTNDENVFGINIDLNIKNE